MSTVHEPNGCSVYSTSEWKQMHLEELEKQYSPSRWSKRYSEKDIIEKHVNKTLLLSQKVRETISGRLNIAYNASKERTKLDVFGEDLPKDSYIMVYVHGGYWQELNKDISLYPVGVLYRHQIITVVVGYTLAPEASVNEIVEEIKESVEWCCQLAKTRQSKGVILMGWSAGAHLITEVLSTTSPNAKEAFSCIRGIISLSGIFDLRPLVNTYVNQPLHLTMDTAWDLSPMNKVRSFSENFPRSKVLIAVAENDSPEFKGQSKQYCKALEETGMKAKFVEIGKVDHFSIVEDLCLEDYELSLKILDLISNEM